MPSRRRRRRFLFDDDQHAKAGEAAEQRLEGTLEAQQPARGAHAEQAPGLKPAAEWIGRESDPVAPRDAKSGKAGMNPRALAGAEKGRDRLVGIIRIAARVRR